MMTGRDGKSMLTYWRASPSPVLRDIDGLDATGFHVDKDGTVWQISTSVVDVISPLPSANRGIDMFWGYKLEPIEGGRVRVTLICQTKLNNFIPNSLANMKIGQVLSDYIKTAEAKGRELESAGLAEGLIERHKIDLSPKKRDFQLGDVRRMGGAPRPPAISEEHEGTAVKEEL